MIRIETGISRRQVLTAAASAAALLPVIGHAQSASPLDKAAFLRISSLLTGFPVKELAGLADPLFAAFQSQSGVLSQVLVVAQREPADNFGPALIGTPLEAVCQQLTVAWYTGMLGVGRNAKVVSHDDALAWPAAGYGVAPGTCAGEFGFWAEAPASH